VKLIRQVEQKGGQCTRQGFAPETEKMLNLVAEQVMEPVPTGKKTNLIDRFGKVALDRLVESRDFLDLVGRICLSFVAAVQKPSRFHLNSIISTIEMTGSRALPITGLLSLLIGIVLAYQLGAQLQRYGADIFVVYLSGTAILREFGPLIAAIIIAGRTSSSFTAQIGMMKVNQEIDAMLTMGLSPVDWLVLPRIIGMVLIFPFLIFWADALGVMGSMLMAKVNFGIEYLSFLSQFKQSISIESLLVGLSKAPVFALVIATVGCYQGFEVGHSADSVGMRTTRSVVQAIFLIIIADATFSVIYSMLGI
jgi:phospholipid/cholesterol/gamma-HCH transport system permease protein